MDTEASMSYLLWLPSVAVGWPLLPTDCCVYAAQCQRLIMTGKCFFADAAAFAVSGARADLDSGPTISAGAEPGSFRYASPTAALFKCKLYHYCHNSVDCTTTVVNNT